MQGVEYTTPNVAILNSNSNTNVTDETGGASSQTSSLNESMHNPLNKGKAKETFNESMDTTVLNNNGKQQGKQTEYITVKKHHKSAIVIPATQVPGKTDSDKCNFAFNKICDIGNFTSINCTTVNGTKVIIVRYSKEELAEAACKVIINTVDKKSVHFVRLNEFQTNSRLQSNTYSVKFVKIPLDFDKPILETYINKIGKVMSIKYIPRGLYLHAHVVFESQSPATFFKDKWSINIGKLSFRCFPSDLTHEQSLHRDRFCLKLANLPKGCSIVELDEVLNASRAKTCFIPKKRDNTL